MAVLALAAAIVAGACNVGFYQGPDRPDDQSVEGPPPPAEFHCERGVRRREVGDGGKSLRVVHVLGNGEVVCSTEDRNGDGIIDTWNLHEEGRVVRSVTVPSGPDRDTPADAATKG
jgi:hypothetical protein